jgi:hypothetical protein
VTEHEALDGLEQRRLIGSRSGVMIEISRWPLAATVSVAERTSSKVLRMCSVSTGGGLGFSVSTAMVSGPSSSPKLERRADVVAPLSLVPVTGPPALPELSKLSQHDGRDGHRDRSPTGSQLTRCGM